MELERAKAQNYLRGSDCVSDKVDAVASAVLGDHQPAIPRPPTPDQYTPDPYWFGTKGVDSNSSVELKKP